VALPLPVDEFEESLIFSLVDLLNSEEGRELSNGYQLLILDYDFDKSVLTKKGGRHYVC
jgi:hypothetical protein